MKMNLKLAALFVLTSAINYTAVAQKAKVVSAYNYNKSYERDKDCSELVKGIESIKAASVHETTGKYAKTWYYGGNLFFNAALTQDKECASKFEGALEKTYDYYLNAMKYNIEDEAAHELDLEKEEDQFRFMGYIMNKETEYDEISYMRDIVGQKFPFMANAFINRGVEAFQEEDYQKAKEYSLKSISLNAFLGRLDTLGMFNAALAAERLEQDEEALGLYSALTKVNYGGAAIYLYMANIHHNNDDMEKKIAIVREGLAIYPDDPDLNTEELDYLLKSGKTEEAMDNFDKAINADPTNATLWYNRGLINDELGNIEASEMDYKKAIELDSTFFDAVYNLGALYYNLGVEWNNKAAEYGLNENDKYEIATEKATDFFKKARPHLEMAHSINETDANTMTSLIQIYAIQGEDEKWEMMKAKME